MSTSTSASRWLKSTAWLADNLGKPDLVVVDASYYLPNQNRDAHAEYLKSHIPGAVFFDIEAICDRSTDLPHMLPGPDQFGEQMGALGISENDTIVVYDAVGLYSAPRVWWSFVIFGAKNAFVLNGGFPVWKAEGRPVEAGEVKRAPKTFNPGPAVCARACIFIPVGGSSSLMWRICPHDSKMRAMSSTDIVMPVTAG